MNDDVEIHPFCDMSWEMFELYRNHKLVGEIFQIAPPEKRGDLATQLLTRMMQPHGVWCLPSIPREHWSV